MKGVVGYILLMLEKVKQSVLRQSPEIQTLSLDERLENCMYIQMYFVYTV